MKLPNKTLLWFIWTARRTTAAWGINTCPATTTTTATSRRSLATTTTTTTIPYFRQHHLYNPRGGSSFTHLIAMASTSTSTTDEPLAVQAEAVATPNDTLKQTQPPLEVFRKDYTPLPFHTDTVEMDFDIRDGKTTVTTTMKFVQNAPDSNDPVVLDGDETSVTLVKITQNGKELEKDKDYELSPGKLTMITPIKDGDVIETVVTIVPEENTQLSGFYKDSGNVYCTQCEALGYRRITYFPDRPDNMAKFEKVTIRADRKSYPVLLSNGDLIDSGVDSDDDSRHYAVWRDPFPKPSYLFALVAGDLGKIEDSYTTTSGKPVKLQIFSERANTPQLHYAMESLKKSMDWDEKRFGLEYDLGMYNIVATNDFNMGAMENKGLNVFNTAYVLADEKTATDTDFERVEGVIGHEYFHNWTGNRVTCRDWFQLTLKEGLTVFRDQEFSGDLNSKTVKRIEDVRILRAHQFREDAGPMSHPVRPESYISMDNFYTATVYNKGAEVIRMYQTILTPEGFNKGMKLYFERHDGSAVTCADFLAAMADANNVDLTQFSRWYETSGTPVVTFDSEYDDTSKTFKLTLTQSSKSKEPLHIPVSVGLIDKNTKKEVQATKVLNLKEETQTFTFDNLSGDVVPSILRDFSAPVKLQPKSGQVNEEDLALLAAYDTDNFNRWEAAQKLYSTLIFQAMKNDEQSATKDRVMTVFDRALSDKETTDYSIQAYTLTLPTESTLAEDMEVVDPAAIHAGRGAVKKAIARKFQSQIQERYDELTEQLAKETEFKVDAASIGRRRLRNTLLEYLCTIKESANEQEAAAELATNHYEKARGMTDKMAALAALASMNGEGAAARDKALESFYNDANGNALVLNKWFSVQALADLPDVLNRVKKLVDHPDFTLKNPNRCRSLINTFAANMPAFHDESGEGYAFLAGKIAEVDKLNPQISSRMANSLIQWRRYDEKRSALMKSELEKLSKQDLSEDLYEIVSRGLK